MKSVFKVLLCLFLLSFGCKAQNNPSDFIPDGYIEFERYFGDLNKDGQDDCILIIKNTDSNAVVTERSRELDRNRRGIIILFKDGDSYRIADKNYDCFTSENEDGGMYMSPELWIEIKDENLKVHYGHGKYGWWDYIFQFRNSNFELIEYNRNVNRGPYIEKKISIDFLTGKKLVQRNTYQPKNEEDMQEVFEEEWTNLKDKNLLKLSEIEDFDELNFLFYNK